MDILQLIVIAVSIISILAFVKTEIDFWHDFRMKEIRQKFLVKDFNYKRNNKFKFRNAALILGAI